MRLQWLQQTSLFYMYKKKNKKKKPHTYINETQGNEKKREEGFVFSCAAEQVNESYTGSK